MKGVFKYATEDDERIFGSGRSSSVGGTPSPPKKYPKRLKRLSLGMPLCILFSINNHQFVLLHTIFLSLHMLCARLGASRSLIFSLFLFCFLFITTSILAFMFWERNPLHSTVEHNIGFRAYLSFCVYSL